MHNIKKYVKNYGGDDEDEDDVSKADINVVNGPLSSSASTLSCH